MGRIVRVLSLSLALAMMAAEAFAATGDMMLEINDSQRVGLYGTAASVIVANPLIADVSMLDSHSLVISAKGFGATRVQAFDGNGRELFNRRITIVAPQVDQVTLHRGASSSEFICVPKCQPAPASALAAGNPAAQDSSANAAGQNADSSH